MGMGTLEDLMNLSQSQFSRESHWDGTGGKGCWGRSGLSKAHPALPEGAKYPGGETVLPLTQERLHLGPSAKA